MIERALDSKNDIKIVNGSFATVSDGSQVSQHVRTRLLFYMEEWFLNLTSGTPWFQEAFTKPADLNRIETIVKNKIASTPGVLSITSFYISLESRRQLKIAFSAETEFGVINEEEFYLNV